MVSRILICLQELGKKAGKTAEAGFHFFTSKKFFAISAAVIVLTAGLILQNVSIISLVPHSCTFTIP
jgi:hypothetical protein